jgi:hypothetical protein
MGFQILEERGDKILGFTAAGADKDPVPSANATEHPFLRHHLFSIRLLVPSFHGYPPFTTGIRLMSRCQRQILRAFYSLSLVAG